MANFLRFSLEEGPPQEIVTRLSRNPPKFDIGEVVVEFRGFWLVSWGPGSILAGFRAPRDLKLSHVELKLEPFCGQVEEIWP